MRTHALRTLCAGAPLPGAPPHDLHANTIPGRPLEVTLLQQGPCFAHNYCAALVPAKAKPVRDIELSMLVYGALLVAELVVR